MQIAVGDRAVMRKPHACGANEWEVTRTGADIGIKCVKCGHRVMLEREKFERAVRRLEPAADAETRGHGDAAPHRTRD